MSPFFYALMWFSLGALAMRTLVMYARVKPLERALATAVHDIGELKQTCDLYEALRAKHARDRGLTPDTHTTDSQVIS